MKPRGNLQTFFLSVLFKLKPEESLKCNLFFVSRTLPGSEVLETAKHGLSFEKNKLPARSKEQQSVNTTAKIHPLFRFDILLTPSIHIWRSEDTTPKRICSENSQQELSDLAKDQKFDLQLLK